MGRLGQLWAGDRYQVMVVIGGVAGSLLSFLYYFHRGHLLEYADSITHQMIARRVTDSPTPGFAQLGGVWPPLPHLVSLPFAWNNWMFVSGVSGSPLSMVCYVLTLVVAYHLARALSISKWASAFVAFLIGINPNMLYMQSTSMTELPLIFGMLAAVYGFIRWTQTGSLGYLTGSIAAVILTSATRYEGWALWLSLFGALLVSTLRRRWPFQRQVDYWLYYLIPAGIFIPAWMAWNKIIIGTGWLGFMNGEYADAGIWVAQDEPSKGNGWIALKTYWYAMQHISGPLLLLLGLGGLALYLGRNLLADEALGVLVLCYPIPFFWLMLWAGQRPLHVPEISGDAYNIRFALQVLPMVALMAGILVDWIVQRVANHPWLLRVVLPGLMLAGMMWLTPRHTITLDEPVLAQEYGDFRQIEQQTASCMQDLYTGEGLVLMETPGNDMVLFYSRLPFENVVYEGTNENNLWQDALADPGDIVGWIYMRQTPGQEDKVWNSLHDQPQAMSEFVLLFETESALFYGRTDLVGTDAVQIDCAVR